MDAQSLIGEVAKRHGILLDRNDPVLVTVTLNEIVLRNCVEQVKRTVEESQVQTMTASAQQVNDARKIASELVTRTGGYVAEQVRVAGAAVRTELEAVLKAELEHLSAERKAAARDRRLGLLFLVVGVAASAVSVLAAVQPFVR